MNSCLNKKVAVALAMRGNERPVYVLSKFKDATTSYVGNILTSTGSIRVAKMIQKATDLNLKLKYVIEKTPKLCELAVQQNSNA